MENWTKIRSLHVMQKKAFRILLGIEFLLLIAGIVGLCGKNAVYEYGPESMTVHFGAYVEERGGVYADEQSGMQGSMVDFANIALPKGVYRVELRYATDVDSVQSCEVTDGILDGKNIRTNGTFLYSGLDQTDFDMWLLSDSSKTVVQANYSGKGTLTVYGLTIRQTNALDRITLFLLTCLITLINIVYLYVQYDKAYHIPMKNKTVTFLLGLTVLMTALPLSVDYMIGGGDLVYHLMRVEGIADGLRTGQFPIRISPEWQQGYGYASPIFYGETVLYLAGLFRLIGFTVTTAYRLFQFVLVVATVLTAYFCFKKIFREAYVGVFCSMIYSLSVYRIYTTWIRGAWGESLGVMFLPVIVYGFYRVFTQDIREESYKRSWLPLTIGFTMLIQSHFLTCEMVGFFTVLLCAVLWKRVFRRPTFLVLAKTVTYSCLLSAWFLVPFADYMLTGNFVIHNVSGRTIQHRGLYLAHLFFTYFEAGSTVLFDQAGMYDTAPMGVGIAPVAVLTLFAFLLFTGKLKNSGEYRTLGILTAGFSVLAMWMSLSVFPWDRIQSISSVTATLVSGLQFPNRLLSIANVCLIVIAGMVGKYVLVRSDKKTAGAYFAGISLLVAVSCLYLTDHLLDHSSPIRVYNHEGMGTGYISGAEYLPYGADASRFTWHNPECSGNLTAENYEKRSLGAGAYMKNAGYQTERVAFSLLYYKGYHAYAYDSGEELDCYAGNNFEVTVDIPAGFNGDVYVCFESPWYWRAGEIVSLFTFLTMVVFFARKKSGGRACRV